MCGICVGLSISPRPDQRDKDTLSLANEFLAKNVRTALQKNHTLYFE